jgi:hypothetical protein
LNRRKSLPKATNLLAQILIENQKSRKERGRDFKVMSGFNLYVVIPTGK